MSYYDSSNFIKEFMFQSYELNGLRLPSMNSLIQVLHEIFVEFCGGKLLVFLSTQEPHILFYTSFNSNACFGEVHNFLLPVHGCSWFGLMIFVFSHSTSAT